MSSEEPISTFTKDLAASNHKLRAAALEKTKSLLFSLARKPATDSNVQTKYLQLWQGLHFCMWMADKPLPQQALAEELAGLASVVSSPAHRLAFLGAFWQTISAEWMNIDSFRMNKFLYLVRAILRASFAMLAQPSPAVADPAALPSFSGGGDDSDSGPTPPPPETAAAGPGTDSSTAAAVLPAWTNGPLIDAHMRLLSAIPLEPRDPRKPNGLRLHLLDIYIDELERAGGGPGGDAIVRAAGGDPAALALILDRLLRPVRHIGKESPTKTVRLRAKEAAADERIAEWIVKAGGASADAAAGPQAEQPEDAEQPVETDLAEAEKKKEEEERTADGSGKTTKSRKKSRRG